MPGNVRPGGPHAEKLAARFRLLTGGEVWRESGPPAPTPPILSRQPAYLPRSRPRTTEVGNCRLGTAFSHRRGLEGVRPSSSHISRPAAAARLSSPLPTAHRRSRKFPPRYRFLPSRRSGGRPALQLPRVLLIARKFGIPFLFCLHTLLPAVRQVVINLTLRYSNYGRNRQIKIEGGKCLTKFVFLSEPLH